jgi:protein-disulfide isomerase
MANHTDPPSRFGSFVTRLIAGPTPRWWLAVGLVASGGVFVGHALGTSAEVATARVLQESQGSQALLFQQLRSIEMQLASLRRLVREGPMVRPGAVPDFPLRLTGAAFKGSRSARVALVEFTDFHCPFCAQFATRTLPELESRYIATGKLLFVLRHFPLTGLHPGAVRASQGAECAGRQERFWQAHDLLFRNPTGFEDSSLPATAGTLGLAQTKLTQCIRGNTTVRVRHDLELGEELGLTATPTFFLGTVNVDGSLTVKNRIDGAADLAKFDQLIAALLRNSE